ncbi:hypothetical protein [Nocardia sp. NPDC056000]|uniref:hypothetical protein n=1 Tax=Nocardia sp. NPDC056000 TaxID=3345674 RepID=UPI0035E00675
MHAEHEEAMRSDFHDCIALSWKAWRPGITSTESDGIYRAVDDYDTRWSQGPYGREWDFLCASYKDWRDLPHDMDKFAQDVRANPDKYTEFGVTEVQRRSIDQAENIVREERSLLRAQPYTKQLPIRRER